MFGSLAFEEIYWIEKKKEKIKKNRDDCSSVNA